MYECVFHSSEGKLTPNYASHTCHRWISFIRKKENGFVVDISTSNTALASPCLKVILNSCVHCKWICKYGFCGLVNLYRSTNKISSLAHINFYLVYTHLEIFGLLPKFHNMFPVQLPFPALVVFQLVFQFSLMLQTYKVHPKLLQHMQLPILQLSSWLVVPD